MADGELFVGMAAQRRRESSEGLLADAGDEVVAEVKVDVAEAKQEGTQPQAKQEGTRPLTDDLAQLVKDGVVTMEQARDMMKFVEDEPDER